MSAAAVRPRRYRVAVIPGDGVGPEVIAHGCRVLERAASLHGFQVEAASANLHPGRRPNLFEPVHGSAPDIAGRGIANPIGAVWSAGMLLDDLGEQHAASAVLAAIERVLEAGVHTPDLGGRATTDEVGDALVQAIGPATGA